MKNLVKQNDILIKIEGVSSPATIMRTANGLGINPGDVFVRVVFNNDYGTSISVSQKLRILGENNYKKLLEAYENEEPINLTITEQGFFYMTEKITVDELFKNVSDSNLKQERVNANLANIKAFLK